MNPFAGVLRSYLPYGGSAVSGVGRTCQMAFEMKEERFSLCAHVEPDLPGLSSPGELPGDVLTVIKTLHLKWDLLEMCMRA